MVHMMDFLPKLRVVSAYDRWAPNSLVSFSLQASCVSLTSSLRAPGFPLQHFHGSLSWRVTWPSDWDERAVDT